VKYRIHDGSIMAASTTDVRRMDAVKEILIRYMERVSPGLGLRERDCIATVWSGGKPENWRVYFEAVRALELGFLRGRGKPRGFDRMVAEQHYALYFRERRQRGSLLRALAAADRGMLLRLPWVRMAAAWVR
jgi:hypothetical protein